MTKKLTCIECPQGCILTVGVQKGRVVKVTGGKCPQGEKYAAREIENPTRILTATVLAKGLALNRIPVKTSQAIPKSEIFRAMTEIKKIKIRKPRPAGDIVTRDFLSLGVNLVITRDCC